MVKTITEIMYHPYNQPSIPVLSLAYLCCIFRLYDYFHISVRIRTVKGGHHTRLLQVCQHHRLESTGILLFCDLMEEEDKLTHTHGVGENKHMGR